jgi:ABC-type polysaccharide/polyol phosphate export permease
MLIKRIKKAYAFRATLLSLAAGDLKLQYSGSRLNIWWAVITPLLLAASINLIFTKAYKIDTPNYTFFVLSGIIPWMFFSNSVLASVNSFGSHASIMRQGVLLPEFIPLSAVLSAFCTFLIGLVSLLPLFVVLKIKVLTVIPFLVFPVFLQLIFTAGLGMIFASWNAFSKDANHFFFITLTIWFWVTPVFYALDMLPYPYRWIGLFNPMTYFVALYNQILFEARPPSLNCLGVVFIAALSCFFSGYLFFLRKEKEILKRV